MSWLNQHSRESSLIAFVEQRGFGDAITEDRVCLVSLDILEDRVGHQRKSLDVGKEDARKL